MNFPGGIELLLVLAVVMLLFGAKKLPELARSMGKAGKEFKTGLKDDTDERPVAGPCPFCQTEVTPDTKFCSGCGKSSDEIVAGRIRPVAQAS